MTDEKVNHPAHYNTGKIEVIDFIEDQKLGFHEGNVVKYVARARHKGTELEDLKKAAWYLNRAIARRRQEPSETINGVIQENAALPIDHYVELPGELPTRAICGKEIKSFDEVTSDLTTPIMCQDCVMKVLEARKRARDQVVHAYFSQNYAGTACGEEPGPGSEVTAEVTCEKCCAWLKKRDEIAAKNAARQVVHLDNGEGEPMCGDRNPFAVATMVTSSVTCPKCRGTSEVKTIHMAFGPPGPLCGAELESIHHGTTDPQAATCIKCKHVYAEEHE